VKGELTNPPAAPKPAKQASADFPLPELRRPPRRWVGGVWFVIATVLPWALLGITLATVFTVTERIFT